MGFIGWDISTSVIGVTYFNDDADWCWSRHLDLNKGKKGRTLLEKGEYLESQMHTLEPSDETCGDHHFIEDKLAGFTPGFSNAKTLMSLGAFNLLCSWIIKKSFGLYLESMTHIHPSTVKSVLKIKKAKGEDKKMVTLGLVVANEPHFTVDLTKTGKPKPYMFDRADSYCIAWAGMRKFHAKR